MTPTIFLLAWLAMMLITAATIFVHFWRERSHISLEGAAELFFISLVAGFFWFFILPHYLSETRLGKRVGRAINDFGEKPRWKV